MPLVCNVSGGCMKNTEISNALEETVTFKKKGSLVLHPIVYGLVLINGGFLSQGPLDRLSI